MEVTFNRYPNPEEFSIRDGQLVYNIVTGQSYMDVGEKRLPTSMIIDDGKISETETWSSEKVTSEFSFMAPSLADLESRITALENKAEPLPQPVK